MALLTQKGYTIAKIAEKYGITKQAVSQILQKAAKDGNKVVLRRRGHAPNPAYDYLPLNKEVGYSNTCIICNKDFQSKLRSTKTCSETCRGVLLHITLIESKGSNGDWSRYEKVQLTCNNCGKDFERSKYRHSISRVGCGCKNDYCSRKCYHEKCRKEKSEVKAYKSNFWPSFDEYKSLTKEINK